MIVIHIVRLRSPIIVNRRAPDESDCVREISGGARHGHSLSSTGLSALQLSDTHTHMSALVRSRLASAFGLTLLTTTPNSPPSLDGASVSIRTRPRHQLSPPRSFFRVRDPFAFIVCTREPKYALTPRGDRSRLHACVSRVSRVLYSATLISCVNQIEYNT